MSMSSENKSYRIILQQAKALFWKHGLRRISVEEICREAGVSKMTFYRLFKNKTEVAEIVLKNIFEKSLEKYRAIMQKEIPYPEKMKEMIMLKQESSRNISEEFLRDIYQYDTGGLKELMEQERNAILGEFMNDFRKAQEKGWIRKDIKPEFILFILNHLTELTWDEQLNKLYDHNSQEVIMQLTNFFFYGIFSEPGKRS